VSGNSPVASFALLVSPSVTTTYTLVSVTDANCEGTIIGTPVIITVENIPLTNLAVSADFSPVCSGGSSSIKIANSEAAVSYQLRNDADNSLIGSAVTGTGGVISLPTGALTVTTTFNVLATRGVCAPVQLLSMSILTVAVSTINTTLSISVLQTPVCAGSGTNIQIVNSETGVSYQLRDDSDNSAVGVAVAGTGGTIDLPTGNLSVTKIFNVLAANGTCSIELSGLLTVNVDVNPDPSLVLAATISPLCIGGSSAITVAASEVGVSYQLRNDADDSPVGAAVAGSGSSIQLPTGVLSATTTFNVLATGGVCTAVQLAATIVITVSGSVDLTLSVTPPTSSICPGAVADFQISGSETGVDYTLIDVADNSLLSAAVSGTGGTITIPTIPLASAKNIKVFATNGSCSAELTTIVSVSINPSPETALTVSAVANTVCSGESTMVEVINSEAGVTYQLRDDADDSNVSGVVAGNGSTISISTGILTNSKIFNVLATIGTCPAELLNTVSIIVNAPPDPGISIVAQDPTVCLGKGTFIQVINSEAGIIYQLRDNADNSIVSGAAFGNGGTIFLPTGPLGTARTFNVIASNVLCGIQLSSTVTVTLLAINDPLCSNCTTATVTTANLTKVTCNASVPDGSVEFLVNPPVPSIDLTGVKIQITGPTSKTQTNNFVFVGLAVGNYTYIVTYGDENNPDCIKTGSFIIELSREPDPVDFDLIVNQFDCVAIEGSVTLDNITGAPGTDFEYSVLSNGATLAQGVISSTVVSFSISDLIIGDHEVKLTQNQESSNGCVGIVSSPLIPFTIAEPAGGCDVFVPNVFTPNGDGTNDLFEVRHLPANSTLFITNRWGKEVFSSSDYQNNWTADNISDGIYYYRLVAEGEVLTGWVEILR
jgi:gliding motility-associated-like protein